MKRFDSDNVWKYVFKYKRGISEAVLYRYPTFQERTVICCSVQSGCPVGCTFCGTGNKFIRNLTSLEIVQQVRDVLEDQEINPETVERFQIMFMSMGEPFLNYVAVSEAIQILNALYPDAELLVSTIAPSNLGALEHFLGLSERIENIGLQFSIHATTDSERHKLIPFNAKLSLLSIRSYGIKWHQATGRKPYLNYCITDAFSQEDIKRLHMLFPPEIFCLTLSVVCSPDETMKDAGYRNHEKIGEAMVEFRKLGYNVRKFDPAGQDDIGGGCGQLWYVQRYLQEK